MAAPKQQLSLFDAVCIILGVIIGAGIFQSTPVVAANVPSGAALIGIWIVGGLLSLVGALCYAELTSSLPSEGGDYIYLTRAFGRRLGFLFAWSEFWIIRPGSIGAMAYVFATYGAELLPARWQAGAEPRLATAAIATLTLTNLLGVRGGKWIQNLLSVGKVLGLLAVIVAGLLLTAPAESQSAVLTVRAATFEGNISVALILVLFAYGGWNDISYVAAEVRHPQRNMLRALAIGVIGVAVIFVLFNVALLRGLGLADLAGSSSAPVQLLDKAIGSAAGGLISALICLATLGAINAMIFTGSRIYYALGREHRLYAYLGHWSERFDAPVRSLLLQSLVALVLVLSFGSDEEQFQRLVIFTAPLFWLFIMLVAIASMVLRHWLPDLPRPFEMPLYPAPALILAVTAAFMMSRSLSFSVSMGHREGFWTLGMFTLGMLLCCWDRKPQA
jgi:basic amino acid/polyamine antiporter, APA family